MIISSEVIASWKVFIFKLFPSHYYNKKICTYVYKLWCNQIGTVPKLDLFHKPTTYEQQFISSEQITTFARHEYGRVRIFRIKIWSLVQKLYSPSKSVNFPTVPIWLHHTVNKIEKKYFSKKSYIYFQLCLYNIYMIITQCTMYKQCDAIRSEQFQN